MSRIQTNMPFCDAKKEVTWHTDCDCFERKKYNILIVDDCQELNRDNECKLFDPNISYLIINFFKNFFK